MPNITEMATAFTGFSQRIISQSINITMAFFAGLVAFFTALVVIFFLLLDKKTLKKGFLSFFPIESRAKTENIVKSISRRVGGYVRGQLMLMVAVGVLTTLGLLLIRMEFALLLGLIAGLLEIIPMLGPVLAASARSYNSINN
ncbi:MAG: AI-2E family transporter [Candidatus Moduliflexus flocculans]|nr:AI-2E family transporter [Candidatus Moduliflexus flocculans]